MEEPKASVLWNRLIEICIVIAISGIVISFSTPTLFGLISKAAATKDMNNARNIYISANFLMAMGSDLMESDIKVNNDMKLLVGEIPDSALCKVDFSNGMVNSVTYMTAGSPGGFQTYPISDNANFESDKIISAND